MIDLQQRVGPWSVRVWGLILNFMANALALYGVAGVMRNEQRWFALTAGCVVTLGCIMLLAVPTPDGDTEDVG